MLIPPSKYSPGSSDAEKPSREIDSTRTVVLVGLMGAGKTTVGRQLAEKLGRGFVDADDEIETAAGRTISDIFSVHGEDAFRAVEKRVIARLLDRPAHVLAAGGGAFMDADTRALIADKAVSVWLRAGLDVLYGRVARRTHRPLLNTTDPRETLARLIDKRYPIYAEADIIVDSIDGPHNSIVDQILDALGRPEKRRDGAPR